MTPEEFKETQATLKLTNSKLAIVLCVSAQSVSNYRCGRQTIPGHVVREMRRALAAKRQE